MSSAREINGIEIERSSIQTSGGDIAGRDHINFDHIGGNKLIIGKAYFADPALLARPTASASRPMPRLLPYLTNRSGQQSRLSAALQTQFDNRINRPLTFFVVGSDDECLDSFVEQVRYICLPSVLRSNEVTSDVVFHSLQWVAIDASDARPLEEDGHSLDDIRQQVHRALGLKSSVDKSTIEQKLADNPVSCFFHIGLSIVDWDDAQLKLIAAWLAWVSSLDVSQSRNPFITIISIVYPSAFLQRLWRQRALRILHRDLRSLANACEGVHALPELHGVHFNDVEHWIREYVEDSDREALRRLIRAGFSRAFGFGQRALSMYQAAEVVKAALRHPSVRTGIA